MLDKEVVQERFYLVFMLARIARFNSVFMLAHIPYRIWESKRSLTIQSANLKMDKVEHFR